MKFLVLIIFFQTVFACATFAQLKHLDKGDTIPSFSLQDQDGKTFKSSDYRGKNILVIYFYPKDESSVCTKEACSFRDSYTEFTNAGVIVVGINHASVETHKKFQLHHDTFYFLFMIAAFNSF